MIDNEIIKALECCNRKAGSCPAHCPLWHDNECIITLASNVFDLINRQKIKIERLEKEVDRLSQVVLYHDGQIADAVKEFAERLKVEMADKKYKYVTDTNYSKTVNAVIDACVDATDNLVKEFTKGKADE